MKTLVACLQSGDSGKGRVSAAFQDQNDWYVKFNGADNSGHTVWKDGIKYALHHLPAGALFGKKVAIDTGATINLPNLKKELDALPCKVDLYISENVHLILPEHLENDKDGSGIGSTKKGIAYVYRDRALRKGIRCTQAWLDELEIDATIYRGLPPINEWHDENALYEGSQGFLLDVDYGGYPFVTSSSVMPSMVHRIDKTIGVIKAYHTRVGDGPPFYEEVAGLSEKGDERGVTTGRRRKSYWNDIDLLDYAFSVVQPDEVVMTKIDILKDVPEIFVWRGGKKVLIGNLDTYINYMIERYKEIKYLSNSPFGDLIKL